MRIFVGYRYGPRDVWVSNYVYRLVRAFGSEVVDGESMYGAHTLADGIVDAIIHGCDGFIGVVSQEVTTRPWVQHELGAARAANKLIVPLREKGVLQNFGMLEDKQFIEYDLVDLSGALVRLAEALGQWHAPRDVFVYLVPKDFADAIRPNLARPGFQSSYRVFNEWNDVIAEGAVKIVEIDRQLQVKLRAIPPLGRYIQFRAVFGAEVWESDFETVNSRTMTMRKLT
jgi:hypothetical protein